MKKKRLQYLSLLLFLTFVLNLCLPCFPVKAETIHTRVSLAETGSAPAFLTEGEATFASSEGSLVEDTSFCDIAGHWAEKEIKAWTARELAGGYSDGTFRPDSPITRAEFLTLVNRAFGYTKAGNVNYKDVTAADWFAGEIANAAAVGYLGGYPDGTVKPQNPITRQEAAALFAKILPPINIAKDKDDDSNNTINGTHGTKVKFADQAQILEWSQVAIATAVSGGYMNGYPDGTFQPTRPITRAEAISVIDRAVGTIYNKIGTYGPTQGTTLLEGNVTINTAGITLQNTTITGNLYLTEGIGEGDVTLDNVTVQGTTKISGGGSDSIHLRNTSVGAVLVNVPSRNLVRLLAQGNTAVGTLEARTPARLEEEGLTGSGFTKVIINTQQAITVQSTQPQANTPQEGTGIQDNLPSQETEPGITIELLGNFSDVEVQSVAVELKLQKGGVQSLTIASTAQSAQIQLGAWTNINTLTADIPATVQGQGTIETTQANADGVIIEAPAKNVLLADGVQATVEGKTITESIVTEAKKKKSSDATLSDLTIDGGTGGTTVPGFAPDKLNYEVILGEGAANAPTVKATAHHAKAKVTVNQATTLPGRATVLVAAENGGTRQYTINFEKATVCGIAVKTPPTQTEYTQDDLLNLDGLVVTLTRTDGSTGEIAFADLGGKGITANPAHGTLLTPADTQVTITHTASGKSVEQDIKVIPTYAVTVAPVSGGTAEVTVDKPKAKAGDTITVSITNLQSGRTFKAITVTSASGDVLTTEVMAGEQYTLIMPAEAITVTVELEAITYTVTFDKNGGDTEADPRTMTVTYGNAVGTLPTAPTREGAVFAGWNTEVKGTGNEFKAETAVTGDITVYAQWEIKVTGVTLNKTELFLQVGTTATEPLTATVEPADAANTNVTWSSSDETIATVDTDGVVTAVAIGEAEITVTTEDGNKTATCVVTVVDNTPIIDDSCVLYLDGRLGGNDPITQTWYDLSGNENHGTLNNFAYAEGSGWTGEALQFDGVDDYVDCGNGASLTLTNVMTLEAWVKIPQKGVNESYIFRKNNSYYLRIDPASENNNISAFVFIGSRPEPRVCFVVPEVDTWYHIVATYDANGGVGNLKSYVNGSLSKSVTRTGNIDISTSKLLIGSNFEGTIAGVRIYNRALSPAEIAQNYLATKDPMALEPVDGAVLDLRGTEGTNGPPPTTVWQDASGNGNDGTLINFNNEGSGSWTEEGLSFNGVDDYVEIAHSPELNIAEQMTISAWFKPSLKTTIEPVILCKNDEYLIRLEKSETPRVAFYVSNGNQYWEPPVRSFQCVTLDEWHNVTAVWDRNSVGSEMKLYVDNVKVKGSRTIVPTQTENPLRIGYWHFTDHFNGTIGDVRIYPRALTDAEVLQNYLAGR